MGRGKGEEREQAKDPESRGGATGRIGMRRGGGEEWESRGETCVPRRAGEDETYDTSLWGTCATSCGV